MTGLAQRERIALCSTLTRVGPDAPTLCDGWTTRDLAAHLVLRERRPDAAAGMFLPVLADHTHRVQEGYADQPWEALVDMVREGPKGWSAIRVPAVDDAVNLAEFFVHHEDVLRAQPGWTAADARALDADLSEALWARLRQVGQLLFRRSPVGVVLVAADYGPKQVRATTKEGAVALRGRPGELVLYGFGRGGVADVEVEGPADAVAAIGEASFGL